MMFKIINNIVEVSTDGLLHSQIINTRSFTKIQTDNVDCFTAQIMEFPIVLQGKDTYHLQDM